jgi:uncharacterized OB-fold protein
MIMDFNIYAYKCKKCGHVQYPYRTICRNCHKNEHNEFDIIPMAKRGKLLTFTHLYALAAEFDTAMLTFGIVELEDGNRITGQLHIEKPRIGMNVTGKVEVVRKDDYNKHYGMIFYQS